MPALFDSLTIRGVTFRNRIAVSPMCEYSSRDGFANDWHLVHLGCRAVGGAGLVMTEAAAVEPRGRISPADLGLWKDEHLEMLARIAGFIREQGAVAGIQLAHAGRKGSTRVPWEGGALIPVSEGGWPTLAPSPVAFRMTEPAPVELSRPEIYSIIEAFEAATRRAATAGFQVVEIHAAHGYLINEFLSPLANRRADEYGGGFDGRTRFALEVAEAVRGAWPDSLPLFIRISAVDWVAEGWRVEDSAKLARRLQPLGVDLVDCSSGGLVPYAKVQPGPGYQVAFADHIRRETGILTGAVGMITDPQQADGIIRKGQADIVLLARQFLRDAYWPLHAAKELQAQVEVPRQYRRAFE